MRWLAWFVIGLVGAVLFWGMFAPRAEHVPATDQLATANRLNICGVWGPAVRVVRTGDSRSRVRELRC
jgi:hypothetical protein